ncbi:hypothetical protein BC834DRAFT_905781 [Gloeopeniophorella convolvens]|nr:hypothetical protein BC834DRAFT_905781 [Gloeopeniophorella convolvens]
MSATLSTARPVPSCRWQPSRPKRTPRHTTSCRYLPARRDRVIALRTLPLAPGTPAQQPADAPPHRPQPAPMCHYLYAVVTDLGDPASPLLCTTCWCSRRLPPPAVLLVQAQNTQVSDGQFSWRARQSLRWERMMVGIRLKLGAYVIVLID